MKTAEQRARDVANTRRWKERNPEYSRVRYQLLKSDPAWLAARNARRRQLRQKDIERQREKERIRKKNQDSRVVRRGAFPSELKRKYGITVEDYGWFLLSQEFACAICRDPLRLDERGQTHLDHCHSTGIVRGLLCKHCNLGIACFGEDMGALARAAKYLERSREAA